MSQNQTMIEQAEVLLQKVSSVGAELLQDANDAIVEKLIEDNNWVLQEKLNGHRRLVFKGNGTVSDFNRGAKDGQGLSSAIVTALQNHPLPVFLLDVEYVSNKTICLFDALWLGDEMTMGLEPYSYREPAYHKQFDGFHPLIVPVQSARTPTEKRALIKRLQAEHAEGFVAKDIRKMYRPGARLNYRWKFVKTLDAVVIGDSTERNDKGELKNSVRLGLFDARGKLKDICGATKKANLVLKPGMVTELIYLYGTPTLDVVQPRIKGIRLDKRPEDCTLDQIVVNKNWRKQ